MNDSQQQVKTEPKDVFLHLGAIATLYVAVINVITLLFEFINLAFPDPVSGIGGDPYSGTIRWSIASLVVVFPLYVAITHLINRGARQQPEKRTLRIKRWLTGLTLFLAVGIIAGDLIALIHTFLGGELSVRFGLKVLALLAVVGTVAGYYVADIKGVWHRSARAGWMLAGIVSAALIAMLIAGFTIMGSPQTQRELRLDEQRVQDLQNIQWQVVQYWQETDRLPDDLTALQDDIRGYQPPRDPVTEDVYTYSKTGDLTFEICATFDRASSDRRTTPQVRPVPTPLSKPGASVEQTWQHPAGNHCFERTIDPERHDAQR